MNPSQPLLGSTARSSDLFSITPATQASSPSQTGKRGAAEASLNLPPTSRFKRLNGTARTSDMSVSELQRRVLELESKEREKDGRIEELKRECERLTGERRRLFEGEVNEKRIGVEREKSYTEETTQLRNLIKELRTTNSKLTDDHHQLKSQFDRLNIQHNSLTNQTNSELHLLTSRLKEVELERNDLKGWHSRAESLGIALEEEKRKALEKGFNNHGADSRGAEARRQDGEVSPNTAVLRQELKRQAQHLVKLQRDHASLQTEVIDLKKRKKEADAIERTFKDVERGLREEIRVQQEQLERARRDMDSLTQTFPLESSSPQIDAATLQQRLQTLSTLHNQTTTELSTKETEIRSLHDRLSELSYQSKTTIVELQRQVNEAERELRWAKDGRISAEKRENLARKEVEALSSGSAGPSTGGTGGGDQTGRIAQLENLVDTYKRELEGISRDSREIEDKLTKGAGLVKQSHLDEAQEKISRLEQSIEAQAREISDLTSANTTLDAEVSDLMRRVFSGEYNASAQRCIELKNNPASRIQAVRTKQLEDLTRENEALLRRLSSEGEKGGEGGIPRESWERLSKEKEDLEKAHAKRLLRLKEIFGTKSKEFLEAVYSLLGWRIKFDESGADIRLTSMYAPKGKMGLTLKFASQEGHFGTMQMTGAMAKGLEDTRHFWIVERQSVPGFLAQITTEMFEKTTIGRAAGYVGLE